MPLTLPPCTVLSAHLWSPLTFLWHQEKCDTLIFFSVWDSTLPVPSVAVGPHHTELEEGKPSVFSLLFARREAHTRQEHSKLFKMLTLQRRGKLFYWLNLHDALLYDSSRFINTRMSCCLVGGSMEGTILFLVPWSDMCVYTEISMFLMLSAEKFALIRWK